jgi:hypothetical protein
VGANFVNFRIAFANMQRLQPNLKPIQTWKEVLSKRVPILGESIACNQAPEQKSLCMVSIVLILQQCKKIVCKKMTHFTHR